MPFTRPTLTQLDQDAQGDLVSALAITGKLLAKAILRILVRVLVRLTYGLYGYLDWIARMSVPFTAEGEFAEAWGNMKGVPRKSWAAATGTFATTGTQIGAVLPSGTPLSRQGDGYPYVTTADGTVQANGTLTAPAVAVIDPSNPQGAAGDCDAGTVLIIGAAVASINTSGQAQADFTGGADVETDDSYRPRYLAAYAQPAQGGAANDYDTWSEAIPGVTRVWVSRNGAGAGTVVVYFMMDLAEAAHGGFPQGTDGVAALEPRAAAATGDQLIVANALYTPQPVTALVYAVAPKQNTVTYSVNLPGASAATKAAIQTAIVEAHQQQGSPGGVVLPNGVAGGIYLLSYTESAVASVPNSAGFVITEVACDNGTVTPGSNGNITSSTGYLAVPANVNWV